MRGEALTQSAPAIQIRRVAAYGILMAAMQLFVSFQFAGLCYAADKDAERDKVEECIRSFETALYAGDTKSAAELCVKDKLPSKVLDALALEHQAKDNYCQAFKAATGTDPFLVVSQTAMVKNLSGTEVDFGVDTAHSFWGGYSLKKVDGKWQIDLAEFDYDRALTEQLDYLRALPDMYKHATTNLQTSHEKRFWVANGDEQELEQKLHAKFDDLISKADDVRFSRMQADVKGLWNVTITPHRSSVTKELPEWKEFTARLEISGDQLKIDAPAPGLEKLAKRSGGTLGVGYSSGADSKQDWDLSYYHVMDELHGSLMLIDGKNWEKMEFYSITGKRIK